MGGKADSDVKNMTFLFYKSVVNKQAIINVILKPYTLAIGAKTPNPL